MIHSTLTKAFNCKQYFPSCLRAIRVLQKNGHVPSDPALFKSYAEYGHFVDIRIAALEAVVDYTKGIALEIYAHTVLERNVYYLKPLLLGFSYYVQYRCCKFLTLWFRKKFL